jgi:bacteriocin biosynthesis cyclodehydratase domain-containing protein
VTDIVQLDPFAHITPYGDDEIFVRRGSRSVYSRLIRDGGRRHLLAPVTRALAEPCSIAALHERYPDRTGDVDEIVAMLAAEGVLRRGGTETTPPTGDPVRLLGAGPIATALARILEESGQVPVELVWEGPGAPAGGARRVDDLLDTDLDALLAGTRLAVVAVDGMRPGLSHAVNEAAADAGVAWLNVAADGPELLVGPLVVPGLTACFNCFEVFDESGRQHRNDFLVYKDQLREGNTIPVRTTQAHLAAAWAALGIEQFVRDGGGFLVERVLRVDTERMEVISERVFQLPRCPVCSRRRPEPRHTFL